MVEFADLPVPEEGKFSQNITHFARALRKAGLPVGPGQVIDAIRAVEAAGFSEKRDFYWTLHACFVRRPEQREVFGQIFRLYWRDPQFLEHMMSMLTPMVRGVNEQPDAKAAERRAAEAILDEADQPPPVEALEEEGEVVEIDATLTFSAEEKLNQTDFDQMTVAELTEAKRAIARLDLPVEPIASRRTRPSPGGRVPDWRGTLREALRKGDVERLVMRERRERWPNLVALCDISGSMSSYSRMLLHLDRKSVV